MTTLCTASLALKRQAWLVQTGTDAYAANSRPMVAKNMTERETVLSMIIWSCANPWRENSYRRQTLKSDFDLEILDHSVRQQLLAHACNL